MKTEHIVYWTYTLFFLLLVVGVFIVPFLAFEQDMNSAYDIFGYTCHQKISRSECIFSDGNNFWFGDCTTQNGSFIDSVEDRETIRVQSDGIIGWKIPICARDVGIYSALLIGGIIYPIFRKIETKKLYPAIYLILAIVPLGLDGTVQLLSEMGLMPFLYESTNMVRLATGLLAGLVSAFYAIPVLMNMFGGSEEYHRKIHKK
jgi:uncharacterized membrane protein